MSEDKRTFDEVLDDELKVVLKSRKQRLGPTPAPLKGNSPTEKAHDAQLVGLAFSGGGIRSATFNLGVLKTLAKKKLLRRFDYISTVSGGGYIGSWLHAWIMRAKGIRKVEEELAGKTEPEPVSFLRRYSNYLTPKLGLFSADTWSVVATYLRNLTLTLAGLFPALGLLVLAPHTIEMLGYDILAPEGGIAIVMSGVAAGLFAALLCKLGLPARWAFLVAGGTLVAMGLLMLLPGAASPPLWLAGAVAALLVMYAFAHLGAGVLPIERSKHQGNIQRNVALPCLGAAFLGSCVLWRVAREQPPAWVWVLVVVSFYFLAIACAFVASRGYQSDALTTKPTGLATSLVAGLAASGPLWGVATLMAKWKFRQVVAWGPPVLTQVFAFAVVVHIGLMGRRLSKARLEWWSRLGAWLFIYNIAWGGLLTVVLHGPAVLEAMERTSFFGTHGAWLALTIGGVLAGRSGSTGAKATARVLKLLVTVAPLVFITAMLALLSRGFLDLVDTLGAGQAALYVALMLGVLTGLVVKLDINRFSMHLFYRNRLVRCYLGASRERPRPSDPFTGFSPEDDAPLSELDTTNGPYAIINTAINLVSGSDLAWQERKAASFSFTPMHTGYEFSDHGGYRPSDRYGDGVTLGTAMAISGAAASPNMGYHSSPSTALLMTIFNVRLGLWAGNTSRPTWTKTGPDCGLCYLIKETLGLTAANTDYVYLSDGGHFENLAAYELVRRRCRFIIVCDAGQDSGMDFDDLGNLIRKCRDDFGIDIRINVDGLRRDDKGKNLRHCAVGTIRYDLVDGPTAARGTLVYIKPSLTGDEPTDIRNYAARNPLFPHQSTGDQWFDESQFESYRRLGQHIADAVLEPAVATENGRIETVFLQLREAWYPPSSRAHLFSRHGEAIDRLLDRIRTDKNLAFLTGQLWPEWERLLEETEDPPTANPWLPHTADEMASGFHYCVSLLQLMENAYIDLNLEEEHRHPDNRGAMNLFRHWSWSSMLRVTWAVACSNYGARFQTFARRHLRLDLGRVACVERKPTARGKLTDRVKRAAKHSYDRMELNAYERDEIGRFIDKNPDTAKGMTLFVLQQVVDQPLGDSESIEFTFGFALVRNGNLVFLRVQDHLRKMGLARRALKELLVNGCAKEFEPGPSRNMASDKSVRAFTLLYRSVEQEIGR